MPEKIKLCVFILVCILFLNGCSQASRLENNAFALVMGIDRMADGQMQMTIMIPKISGGNSEDSGGSSAASYALLSVTAEDYEAALEKLDWAAPRNLNLSHLKLIVLSREIAEEERCRSLIENIAQTERLFTSAWVAVCENSAKGFVSALQPTIGTRISTDIDAIFDHYIDSGYLPGASLADLYYQTESVYSDPMVAYAILAEEKAKKKEEAKPASVFSESAAGISDSYESDFPTRYLGAAVFSEGRLRGVLNGAQTIISSLLRNEIKSFRYAFDGQSLAMVPTRACFVRVETDRNPVRITINAQLSIASQEERPNEEKLRKSLTEDILSTIHAAQKMKTEPFGFAQRAARSFLTFDEWMKFDWRKRFSEAEIDVKLKFARSDA